MRIAVLSDTHGLLRDQVKSVIVGCDAGCSWRRYQFAEDDR